MKRQERRVRSRVAIIIMGLMAWQAAAWGVTRGLERYTKGNPLVIVCDIEQQPFEYCSDAGNGEAVGYNVELLKMLMKELQVPYTIVSKEKTLLDKAFYSGNAQLMIGTMKDRIPGVFYGTFAVASYKVAAAHTPDKPDLLDLSQLTEKDTILLKEGDYADYYVSRAETVDRERMEYSTLKSGLYEVQQGNHPYMIGSEESMRAIIEKYKIEEMVVNRLNVMPVNMVFISRDRNLVELLDKHARQLEEAGRLTKLNKAYFSKQKKDRDIPTPILVGIAVMVALIALLFIVSQVVKTQVRKNLQRHNDLNNIILKAIDMGGGNVVVTDLKKMELRNLYGNHLPGGSMSQKENFDLIHRDDQPRMHELFDKLKKSHGETVDVKFRWNKGTEEEPQWRTCIGQTIGEFDKKGQMSHLITTITDVTEEERRNWEDKRRGEIFKRLFQMPLTGLALYDKKGRLVEANDTMWTMMGGMGSTSGETCLFDLPCVRGNVDRRNVEEYYVCSMDDMTGNGQNDFIDFRVGPIRDTENGELRYIMVTARDMRTYRDGQSIGRKLDAEVRERNLEVQRFSRELKYLLDQSNMTAWRSNFNTRTITLFKQLKVIERKISFDEYIDLVEPESRALAKRFLDPTGDDYDKPLKGMLKMSDSIYGGNEIRYYHVSSIPDHDAKGNITGRFGLTRDINDVMVAQDKMRKEKERAEDSSRIKSMFLANMSHEIRTPLNAIVGFCDVLTQVEDPADREEFLKIIDSNCELLLKLIDDILVISEAESTGLSIKMEVVDFPREFDIIAASLSLRVTNPEVEFQKDNPMGKLKAVVDIKRIQQLLTNFVTNAVKYTTEGHIKIGYKVKDKGLYLYCEDTGTGIPKEKKDKVFGRFVKLNDYVQGAGLGLSICKSIAERWNGDIGVDSEVGKGSTFWAWLPCEMDEN